MMLESVSVWIYLFELICWYKHLWVETTVVFSLFS